MTKQSILATSPTFWLWHTNNKWQNNLRVVLKQANLGYVEFVLLAVLAFDMNWKAMNQKQLARQVRVDTMVISQALRSLEDKKLVCRTKGIIDGRAYSIRTSSQGFNLIKKVMKDIQAIDKQILEELTDDPIFSIKLRIK